MLIKIHKIVALQKLVGKLGERHPHIRIGTQAFLYRILRHHVIDRDMLADVANKIQKCIVLHPVVIVHELGRIRSVGIEIEEFGQLFLDTFLIVPERFLVEQVSLGRFHRGIADHPRRTTHQRNRTMSRALEMPKHHYTDQMPDMQRIGCRVYSYIRGRHPLPQTLFRSGHHVMHHTPPFQFFNKIHRFIAIVYFFSRAKVVIFLGSYLA